MKRFIVYGLVLIIGVFFLGGCNTPTNTTGSSEGGGEEVVFDWGSGMKTAKFEVGAAEEWKGQSFDLSGATTITGGPVGNIDLYSSIILEADLYDMDEILIEGSTPSLAQFALLPGGGGDWDADKLAKGDNMKTGATSGAPLSGKTAAPTHLLLEVQSGTDPQVGYINVRKLTLIPKTGDVVLKPVFGDSATISGNKIIFDNASYGDTASGNNWDGTTGKGSAVLLVFPESAGVGSALAGKTIRVNFTIEPHTCSGSHLNHETEHQLNVQAAADTPEKEYFNGQDPKQENGNVGQAYITLDSAQETGYDTASGTGTFTIPADKLIAASNANINGNDGVGPFTLDSVRISNNGTQWNEAGVGQHYRCKSYTLVINSITIQ